MAASEMWLKKRDAAAHRVWSYIVRQHGREVDYHELLAKALDEPNELLLLDVLSTFADDPRIERWAAADALPNQGYWSYPSLRGRRGSVRRATNPYGDG